LAERVQSAAMRCIRLAEGHGHFSLGVANRDEIFDELLAAAADGTQG
jgi:hypothetical protein